MGQSLDHMVREMRAELVDAAIAAIIAGDLVLNEAEMAMWEWPGEADDPDVHVRAMREERRPAASVAPASHVRRLGAWFEEWIVAYKKMGICSAARRRRSRSTT